MPLDLEVGVKIHYDFQFFKKITFLCLLDAGVDVNVGLAICILWHTHRDQRTTCGSHSSHPADSEDEI